MYKAGDFTNGKMNSIFKDAFDIGSADITHKQFGEFTLVNKACEIEYLLTPLEIVYGVYSVNIDGTPKLISVLDERIDEAKKENHEILDADQFEASNLINGLLFLLDEFSSPTIERGNFVLRKLMELACLEDEYIGNFNFHKADKDRIKSGLIYEGCPLDSSVINSFLNGDSFYINEFFKDVIWHVVDAAVTSMEHDVSDWNYFEYSSIYFSMRDRYSSEGKDAKLKQEFVAICMEHLEHLGVITRNCQDTYKLNVSSISI